MDDGYTVGLNPLACTTVELFGGVTQCVDVWMSIWEGAGKEGFLKLTEFRDAVGLSFNALPSDALGEVLHELEEGHQFMTWNKQKLISISLPFDDLGKIEYKNGDFHVDLSLPGQKYDFDTGTWKEYVTQVDINGGRLSGKYIIKGTFSSDMLEGKWN